MNSHGWPWLITWADGVPVLVYTHSYTVSVLISRFSRRNRNL